MSKENDKAAIEEMWRRKRDGREVFAHAELTEDVVMRVWNGRHPVRENTAQHTALAGTKVLVTMLSRFGDCGVRDRDIDKIREARRG